MAEREEEAAGSRGDAGEVSRTSGCKRERAAHLSDRFTTPA
jgi:hypothetical protein